MKIEINESSSKEGLNEEDRKKIEPIVDAYIQQYHYGDTYKGTLWFLKLVRERLKYHKKRTQEVIIYRYDS